VIAVALSALQKEVEGFLLAAVESSSFFVE